MAAPKLLELSFGGETRQGLFAHCLEHRQTDIVVREVAAHKAPADERLQIGQEAWSRLCHRLRVLERASVHEHREHAMQLALALSQ